MAKLIITYWRDIPAQVVAKQGRKTAKAMLPDRFQEAIDRAAMRAGKGSSDAYMEDWRREYSECDDNLQSHVSRVAAELDAQFSDDALEKLVKAKGLVSTAE